MKVKGQFWMRWVEEYTPPGSVSGHDILPGLPRKRVPDPYAPCILVVDDDVEIQRLFSRILEEAGYFVKAATGGREALQLAEDWFFELAVVDMSMPDMDGFEVIKAMRESVPGVKILMVSGYTAAGNLLPLAKKLGASATLQKPFDVKTLLNTVCGILASTETATVVQ
jgi:CheY-like chemotaxis protein